MGAGVAFGWEGVFGIREILVPGRLRRRLNATFIEDGAVDAERESMRYRSEEQAMHHRQRAAHHRREAKRFAAAELHSDAQLSRTAALAQERLVYALETGRLPR